MAVWKLLDRFLVLWQLLGLLRGDSLSTKEPDGMLSPKDAVFPSTLGTTPAHLADSITTEPSYLSKCPSAGLCVKLDPVCMNCMQLWNCTYGKDVSFNCTVKPRVHCTDENKVEQKTFQITMICRFCWQLPPTEYQCKETTKCKTVQCPREYFISNCTTLEHVHCLGNRTFQKKMYCNWTGGYKWSTALALSDLLGALSNNFWKSYLTNIHRHFLIYRVNYLKKNSASHWEGLELIASIWASGRRVLANSSASEGLEYGR
ncbi:TM2 domain-containing protein 3 isoform X3 [Carcharodon carcharias]|uniref:TM2 domain-containing protein 3 isoform X3 n=1 Tax=Carcharodon carcharias TaxID=13397 RepID=UPI001B7EEDF2|nr:TM2 domain-containing protein 3 isoform X3 [Carcharodon carcharias]